MIGYDIFDNLKSRYKGEGMFRILFCPYKEEMWDSMETIYERACQDDETVADIMPIPYFTLVNLLPDTTKIEFKLFQNNFPEILNKYWDVILIHYPYDTKNNVTRPMMTSPMLKFFCKKLVLIGYAVIGGRDISPEEAVYPAMKNADVIICEREKHAEQTYGYLKDLNPNVECFGWGSPKYDKLDIPYELPDDWKKKTEGRRVILLQTSLKPYLNNPDKLNQIEKFINRFWNDDTVCLWWRPHPLLAETIKAHKPNELKEYLSLVEKVRNSRHILDDTSNLRRAISMTDEMVSDVSSVVFLYQHTGKPIRFF